MGSVHAKPTSARMMKNQYGSRSHGNRQSLSLSLPSVIIKGLLLALAASSLPFLIIYTLPSLHFFLFAAIPSLWRCSCDLFTPKNLFVLLNLIILSIFAMAHLHSSPAASISSSLQPSAHDDCARETSEDGTINHSLSEAIKLDDQKSADLQLVNIEVESNVEQINDQQAPLGNHGAYKDDDQDNTGVMMFKEMIIEPHLQHAGGNGQHFADHQIDEQKADPESKKAEKAKICAVHQSAPAESKKSATSLSSCVQGNPLPPSSHDKFINIDSLLSEESSVFTLAKSRPLPSARFTHKKATKLAGLDRPLSPLKMSRPILKRGDTLDATWKAICESKRHCSPLNRHHSKHTRKVDPYEETIEGVVNKPGVSSSSPLSPIKQRSKITMNSLQDKKLPKSNPLIRREPSMPQEELNAKVESFISRFNEQIRIQREKSLLDYMEMVGRGSS